MYGQCVWSYELKVSILTRSRCLRPFGIRYFSKLAAANAKL